MKSRENEIRNNKNLFDDKELPEGHFERFEALLNKEEIGKEKVSKRFRLVTIFSAVASVILLIGAGIYFSTVNNDGFNNSQIKMSNEFYTTNDYYKQQMQVQIDNIMCKLDMADNETRIQLVQDIESIISENNTFVTDIQKNDNEEIAIFYMVEHYKTNIEVLEFINSKLENHVEC